MTTGEAPFVMRAVGFADGSACPFVGQYLSHFDANAHDGRGWAEYTRHVDNALRFRDAAEAWRFWRTISRVRPVRPDGKPNRPLTSTTIEILNLS